MSMSAQTSQAPRADVYTRVTDRIVSDLEKGVRPWLKPWSADRAAERLPSLPLRHNGTPYRGMNILLLWGEAIEKGYSRTIWMTYKHRRKRRACAQGRTRFPRRLCGSLQQDGTERKRGRRRALDPVHERLYRLQCRADRRTARAL